MKMRAQGFIVYSLIVAVWAMRAEEKLPVLMLKGGQ
jgi:hypothetical protein